MNKKSVFNSLFSKSQKNEEQETELDAVYCLRNLADAYLGKNTRLDVQINKFNTMLKVGSHTNEIIDQIEVLRKVIQDKNLMIIDEAIETDTLSKLPAKTFISALIEEPIDASLKVQLKHYRKGLDDNETTRAILGDIINLLESEISTEALNRAEKEVKSKALFDTDDITAIKAPIIRLLDNFQDDNKLRKNAQSLLSQAETITKHDELISLLENTSELILSSMNNSTGQFEHFLLSLKERLTEVDAFVNLQDKTNKALADCSDELSMSMSEQVGELRTSVSDSSSLKELENHVTKSIESILAEMESFNSRRETLQDDSSRQINDLQAELEAARHEAESLRDNLKQQRQRAMTDPLTRLPNRQAYDERLQLEYHRWQRYNKPLSLVMGDLDHFKMINDNYGHTCGDYVLQQIAKTLTENLRETDFVARFGGEEFVILLPETNLKEAVIAMNKLRTTIHKTGLEFEDQTFNVTMSFGAATFETKDDYNLVFNRADTALYRAKSRGRNQVCAELKKSA